MVNSIAYYDTATSTTIKNFNTGPKGEEGEDMLRTYFGTHLITICVGVEGGGCVRPRKQM